MLYSNLYIWRLLRDTSGYISEKILTSVLLSYRDTFARHCISRQMVCFSIKL